MSYKITQLDIPTSNLIWDLSRRALKHWQDTYNWTNTKREIQSNLTSHWELKNIIAIDNEEEAKLCLKEEISFSDFKEMYIYPVKDPQGTLWWVCWGY